MGWGDGLIKSNNDFHTTTQNATVQLFTYRYRYRLWATSTSEVKCDAEVAPFLFSFLVLVFLCVDAAPPSVALPLAKVTRGLNSMLTVLLV